MTEQTKSQSGFMNSIAMGALTLGTGIALKWLMQQKNRQKLYDALDNVLADSADVAKAEVGKLSQVKSKVRDWMGSTTDSQEGKSTGRKQVVKKAAAE